MGSQWVEDPSWGNIFSGIAGQMEAAPGKALSNIAQAEAIKDARIKRQREQQMWDLGIATGADLEKAIPPAYVPPTDYTTPGPLIGNVNNPADTAGLPSVDLQYTDPRALAAAEARRQLAVSGGRATVLKDPSQWAPQLGYGSVAAGGVPQTAQERAQTQFLTTGKFPTEAERAPPPVHNLAIVGPDGQPTGQSIATQDYKRDMAGRPIQSLLKPGESVLATGPASTTPSNPYESEAVAARGLAKIQADTAARGHMTEDEVKLATRLFDVAHPISRVTENEGGRLVEKQVRAKPIPPSLMPLYQLTQDYAQGKHLQPPVTAGPGAQPPPIVPPGAQPAPIVPPQPVVDPNASRVISRGPASSAELRKEVNNTQQFSDWNTTVPLFNSAIKSAKNPNNQEDINIIYAFAKLMDPGSVVRESEQRLVSTSGTVPQSILGQYNKLVTGGGSMDPEVRLQIIDTLKNRLEEYQTGKNMVEQWYRTKVAPAAGLNPDEVIPPTMEPIQYNRDELVRLVNQQRSQVQPQAPVSPVVDQANKILGGR